MTAEAPLAADLSRRTLWPGRHRPARSHQSNMNILVGPESRQLQVSGLRRQFKLKTDETIAVTVAIETRSDFAGHVPRTLVRPPRFGHADPAAAD